jgi:hypothetical protein
MPKLTFRQDSFLRDAGFLDDTFLDLNNLPSLPQSVNDERYVINAMYDERPDLLAHDLYGSTRLWWVFTIRNPDLLKDPIRDFKAGLEIFLPSAENVNIISGRSR